MADDLTVTGTAGDPTVTLRADAGPFEMALDKAAAKVSGWGTAVEGRFAKVADAVKSKTAKFVDAVGRVNAAVEGGMSAGAAIGALTGGGIGAMIGGPIGAKIGSQIGEAIGPALGDTVDFAAGLAGANSLKAAVEDEVAKTADAWAGLKWSAQKRFEEVRNVFSELNLADLIRGDAESAGAKLEDVFGRATAKVELLIGQGMARVADRIDSAFDRVKEPVAQVADFLQAVGEQLGLVEEGTVGWGDQIRSLENVGVKAFRAIGAAVGYVEAALAKAGATVVRAVQKPIADALAAVLGQVREVLKWAAVNTPDWAGGAKLTKWAAGLDGVEDRVRRLGADADKWAADALAKPWEEFARERADKFEAMVGAGRAQNAIDDAIRNQKGPDAGGGDRSDPMKAVSALIGGSSGAQAAITAAQRSTANAAAQGPQQQAVKKLDELNKKQAEANKVAAEHGHKLDRLAEAIEEIGAT